MQRVITWRDLKNQVNTFSEAQLDMRVLCCAEDYGGAVVQIEVLDEDHINPSGDAWEPRSHYGADYENEEIVAVKGQPVLHVD